MQFVYFCVMKSVRLTDFQLPDQESAFAVRKKYSVYLGNDYTATFTRKRDAKAFLSECNRFLSYQVHQINALYGNCLQEYRRAWPYFAHNKKSMGSSQVAAEYAIKRSIGNISEALERVVMLRGTVNHNKLVFSNINLCIKELQRIISALMELYRSKNHGAVVVVLDGMKKSLEFIRMEIDGFPNQIQVPYPVEISATVLRAI